MSSNFKISTKYQHFDLTKTPKSWPNIASEYRPRIIFITSTKDQQQILNKLQLQNLASKSGQKFHFMTKLQLPNMHQTINNMFLSINISNSNNLKKFWVGIFTRQGHINQVYKTGVSQWVSYWQGKTKIGLGSDKKSSLYVYYITCNTFRFLGKSNYKKRTRLSDAELFLTFLHLSICDFWDLLYSNKYSPQCFLWQWQQCALWKTCNPLWYSRDARAEQPVKTMRKSATPPLVHRVIEAVPGKRIFGLYRFQRLSC